VLCRASAQPMLMRKVPKKKKPRESPPSLPAPPTIVAIARSDIDPGSVVAVSVIAIVAGTITIVARSIISSMAAGASIRSAPTGDVLNG
jgi:hypothetical protein